MIFHPFQLEFYKKLHSFYNREHINTLLSPVHHDSVINKWMVELETRYVP